MAKLDIVEPITVITKQLQQTLDLVSFGLQSADSSSVDALDMPGTVFQVLPATKHSLSIEETRSVFKIWVLTNGLRNFVDIIGPSLEWARKICFLSTRPGEAILKDDGHVQISAKILGEEWNKEYIEDKKRFDLKSLKKKLDWLKNKYGLLLPELSESILSLNRARNCMTHRSGVVGQDDISEDTENSLLVEWRKFQIFAHSKNGKRVVDLPGRVENEQLSLEVVKVQKVFKLGDQIEFSPSELVEIAQTFLFFAQQIQQSIRALQLSRVKTE
jgi:hypothetical protein